MPAPRLSSLIFLLGLVPVFNVALPSPNSLPAPQAPADEPSPSAPSAAPATGPRITPWHGPHTAPPPDATPEPEGPAPPRPVNLPPNADPSRNGHGASPPPPLSPSLDEDDNDAEDGASPAAAATTTDSPSCPFPGQLGWPTGPGSGDTCTMWASVSSVGTSTVDCAACGSLWADMMQVPGMGGFGGLFGPGPQIMQACDTTTMLDVLSVTDVVCATPTP